MVVEGSVEDVVALHVACGSKGAALRVIGFQQYMHSGEKSIVAGEGYKVS